MRMRSGRCEDRMERSLEVDGGAAFRTETQFGFFILRQRPILLTSNKMQLDPSSPPSIQYSGADGDTIAI